MHHFHYQKKCKERKREVYEARTIRTSYDKNYRHWFKFLQVTKDKTVDFFERGNYVVTSQSEWVSKQCLNGTSS